MRHRVVLDTNCLIASLSRRGEFFKVWRSFIEGKYILCYSNEILVEYEEMLARLSTPLVATNVVQAIVQSVNTIKVDPYFHFGLITSDYDDNKFVDCAIAANATYIVSEDKHLKVLESIDFPRLNLVHLIDFLHIVQEM